MNKKLLVPDSYVGKKNKTKDNVGFESELKWMILKLEF